MGGALFRRHGADSPHRSTRAAAAASSCARTRKPPSHPPCRLLVDGVAIEKLPAKWAPQATILRNYTRVGKKARQLAVGFSPNRRRPNTPGGHLRCRDGSLRITEEGTGRCMVRAAGMHGRPLRYTDGVGKGNRRRALSNSQNYTACANIRRPPSPREYSAAELARRKAPTSPRILQNRP